MSDDTIQFEGCLPYLWLKDVKKGIEFYRDVVGFELDYDWYGTSEATGNPAAIAEMTRGPTRIILCTCNCLDGRHTGQGYFRQRVEPVQAMHDELVARGQEILFGPRDEPWGVRTFTIEDPEGNRIEFEGRTPE